MKVGTFDLSGGRTGSRRLSLPARVRNAEKPALLTDLYKDLKDRRLLPVVIGLLVAIIAVPLALSSSPAMPGPSSAAELSQIAQDSKPAVTASAPELRDFRRRLTTFAEKDPFAQQLTQPKAGTTSLQSVPGGGSSGGGASLTSGSPAPTTPTPFTGNSGSTSGSTGSGSTGGGSTGGGTTSGGTKTVTRTVTKFVGYRVDMKFGHAGRTILRHQVEPMTTFPSKKLPLVAFLGAPADGKSALYLVSQSAGAQGEGTCAPSAANCEFLRLKPDQTEFFDYSGPSGQITFELKLLRINAHTVQVPKR